MTVSLGKGDSLDDFMKNHKLQKLIYSGKGGFFESYLCLSDNPGI